VAYIVGPLIFLAALRPSRAALADIAWPADEDRRQALVLLLVPLVLPALVNLAMPYRLTPDWTFPNWALLPVVLFGSRYIVVDQGAAARAGLVALAATLLVIIASPVIACVRLVSSHDQYRTHYRQVAEFADRFAGQPIRLISISGEWAGGLRFYLPRAQTLTLERRGTAVLLIVCPSADAICRKNGAALTSAGARTTTVAFTRSFLGFSGPPMSYQITVVPPD
jgi:hypothetical protein